MDLHELDFSSSGDYLAQPLDVGAKLIFRWRLRVAAEEQALDHDGPLACDQRNVVEYPLERNLRMGAIDAVEVFIRSRVQLRPYLPVARVERGKRALDLRPVQLRGVRDYDELDIVPPGLGFRQGDRFDYLVEIIHAGRFAVAAQGDIVYPLEVSRRGGEWALVPQPAGDGLLEGKVKLVVEDRQVHAVEVAMSAAVDLAINAGEIAAFVRVEIDADGQPPGTAGNHRVDVQALPPLPAMVANDATCILIHFFTHTAIIRNQAVKMKRSLFYAVCPIDKLRYLRYDRQLANVSNHRFQENDVMYRPGIKVVDCTIRDGGLTNNSHFTAETVRAVYKAVCQAGIDYVELGYRNSRKMFSPEEFGPWRFCDDEQLHEVTDGIDPGATKLAVMMDAHKSTSDDILPSEKSCVDMIRVATYVKDVDKAIGLAKVAHEKGYETTINIMAISVEGGPELAECLRQLEEETNALAVYVVDSFGALYSEEVHFFVETYQMHVKTKEVGVHMHNSQQLAFANTIEGIIKGANFVDGTLYGLGRGAGNCPTELLLGFLKNPKFDIAPLLEVLGEYILPLQKEIDWGYHVPYMLTAARNLHPLAAIEWMADPDKKEDLIGFYKKLEIDYE